MFLPQLAKAIEADANPQGVKRMSDIDRRRLRRRRRLIAVVVVVLGPSLCWGTVSLGRYVNRAHQREFLRQVHPGMTRDQVIAAVGEPDARVQPGAHIDDATNTTWYPSQNFAVRNEAFV